MQTFMHDTCIYVDKLESALISNLLVNQINFGKKLNVTIISESIQAVGVQVIAINFVIV